MSRKEPHSIHKQNIDGNARVHNGDTYIWTGDEFDVYRKDRPRDRLTDDRGQFITRILGTLSFDQMHTRQQNLQQPTPKTCRWILETPTYRTWVDPGKFHIHKGFFWIRGKPGVGKSILTNYMLTNSVKQMPRAKPISFFFNARGHEYERALSGLYRSMLFQLLSAFPDIAQAFYDLNFRDPGMVERNGWQEQSLKNVISRAIGKLRGQHVACYVDALDECPEAQTRSMIQFFRGLGDQASEAGVRLNVCFLSRHYPNISIGRGLYLIIERNGGHQLDMKQYIETNLIDDSSLVSRQEINDHILEKASGVFLWVVLVIPMLNAAFDSGKTEALNDLLCRLPSELMELIYDMLTRDSEDWGAMLLCIQLVMSARRLTSRELYFAIHSGLNYKTPPGNSISGETIRRYIISSSKGLVEEITDELQGGWIQFIHESIRDFFLTQENGIRQFWPDLGAGFMGESQEAMKQARFNQVQSVLVPNMPKAIYLFRKDGSRYISGLDPQLKGRIGETYPFLWYAIDNTLFHSNEAESLGVQQSIWMQHVISTQWIGLRDLLYFRGGAYSRPDANILFVLASQNLIHLVKHCPGRTDHLNVQGGYPLCVALAYGHCEVARYLGLEVFLEQGLVVELNERDEAYFSKPGDNRYFDPSVSLLAQLAQLDSATAMKIVLQVLGKNTFNQLDDGGQTPLFHAINNGSVNVVQWLCSEESIGLNIVGDKDHAVLTHLCKDLRNSHINRFSEGKYQDILQALVRSERVQKDYRDALGRTPLSYAAEHGPGWVINLLLETKKVDINSRDKLGRTPLSYAAEQPYREFIYTLFSCKGIAVNLGDCYGRTPLSYAAECGHHGNVEVLLNSGKANANLKDAFGQSPLHWVILNNDEWQDHLIAHRIRKTVYVLLKTGRADVDSEANDGLTPLTRTKLILQKDMRHMNALDVSCFMDCIETMERYKLGESIEGVWLPKVGIVSDYWIDINNPE
ncbi:uncharacterized protein F4822DRAFT_366503 [Hypoxylon trugodes]|uniref:uncharacterized protein n=1 Tax=Hypoxylon trugodes TaxID=326681 RepID=UPI002197ED3A|nr:uncharacterized protein F4822DRAFT_366503 [Hypoxylon trugodes]KAI1384544.1 hypothetical protein F4822DRAFT_366503 [Hypoxylon trugodes]